MDTMILSEKEQESFLNLLFDTIKQQKLNSNSKSTIKSMDITLLFRGSEHDYDCNKFHKYCDDKGPTVTVIHNHLNHVFGGYISASWINSVASKLMMKTPFYYVKTKES